MGHAASAAAGEHQADFGTAGHVVGENGGVEDSEKEEHGGVEGAHGLPDGLMSASFPRRREPKFER
ncbi:hypothetical protein BN2497_4451 [Janthinobacterium sp. CG23_2]|nr:hypothetical protein BN2497_4451 [Janthinobacterium sp. CG23_2]CUU28623.1 hypothetical protein BN3177_4451 [Janthinobacterium sp. CG23_2]